MKKVTLRKQFLAKRRALAAGEVELRSQQIAAFFFDTFARFFFKPPAVRTIHTFLPILHNNEVDTWPIVQRLWGEFPATQVLAPVTNFTDETMINYVITPATVFRENRFGIPEPVVEYEARGTKPGLPQLPNSLCTSSLSPTQVDLVLVPLLAFDQQGQRVGYGGGFYDRFLAQCRPDCLKIGLSLFDPIEQIDDVYEGDIPLDYCLTHKQIWSFQESKPT